MLFGKFSIHVHDHLAIVHELLTFYVSRWVYQNDADSGVITHLQVGIEQC